MALIDPPCAFAPNEAPELTVVDAVQPEQGASLILTLRVPAFVPSQALVLVTSFCELALKLHAYAPTCTALIDPPREDAP